LLSDNSTVRTSVSAPGGGGKRLKLTVISS
jgi:hypothetical protein